jgi:5-methylcytosine-specific restriction endonuclease McrA
MIEAVDILSRVCALIADGQQAEAEATINREYPFVSAATATRKYGAVVATRVFARDGFLDRYTGERLVFPGALRLLSIRLPVAIPYHLNWKISETHPAFWKLCATIDHVIPVTRSGTDEEDNLITTSMIRNSAKANWLLEELGWQLRPIERVGEWDGLTGWFVGCVAADKALLQQPFVRRWYGAARICGFRVSEG